MVAVLKASDKDLHSPKGTQNYNLENTIKKGMEMLGQPSIHQITSCKPPRRLHLWNKPGVTNISVVSFAAIFWDVTQQNGCKGD